MKLTRMTVIAALLLMTVLVLAACGGTATTAVTTPASDGTTSTSGLDGKTILENACQSCHSLTVVEREHQDAAGWTRTVEKMMQKGAKLTADEKNALIQYLAETY